MPNLNYEVKQSKDPFRDDVLEINNVEKFLENQIEDVVVHYSEDEKFASIFSELARKLRSNRNIIFVKIKSSHSPSIVLYTNGGKQKYDYNGPRTIN